MTGPLAERALLLAARDVLSKTAIIQPVLNDYQASTGATHPLETALGGLQTAVDAYEALG